MMMLRPMILVLAVLTLPIRSMAQGDATSCEQAYGNAKALYDDGRLPQSLLQLDSLCISCRKDKDQLQRILFLRALIEARNDATDAMRSSFEQLFRNDRRYVLKPYDPLIVGQAVKEDMYATYEKLAGSRDVGPGQLRKDHGQWRVGLYGQGHQSLLDVGTVSKIFEGDALPKYTGLNGWEAGVIMEWDVIPNLALRVSGGWSVWSYEAKSSTVRYKENLTIVPVSLGLKKMFWIKDSPWVPYLVAEGIYGQVLNADATIERSGDGLRFLAPKTVDRVDERTAEQLWVAGAVGVGYKVNSVILSVEGHYRYALSDLTKEDAGYTESELLTNYYWVDDPLTLSGMGVTVGIQYVLRYHSKNRIY